MRGFVSILLVLTISTSVHNCLKMLLSRKFTNNRRMSRLLSAATTDATSNTRKRLVFLGTPNFAADSLQTLFEASKEPSSSFDVVAVVTQPVSGLQKKVSPVQLLSRKLQLPLLSPETAKDTTFLEHLESLQVDLCITAAYGNYLPKRFLAIPKYGTVNIHPSLLPKYRGAAPVQRCLENGDTATGVSVAYTVQKMDAGPIIAQVPYPLTGSEKAPAVLADCFRLGTEALIHALPGILSGTALSTPQDESAKTEAPKLTMAESAVDFASMSAVNIHNKCRGFAEWPGIVGTFQIGASEAAVAIKIVTTVVLDARPGAAQCTREVSVIRQQYLGKDAHMLRVVCGDGSVLGVVELLPPSRKVMFVKDFLNGIKGDRSIRWADLPVPVHTL
jgi:methionyl-tRNA formyltransferase